MSETRRWTKSDLDRMIGFLPIFEAPTFIPALWPKLPDRYEDGVRITSMPYPEYHPAVEAFRSCSVFVHPYDALPEDETQEPVPFSVMGVSFSDAYFQVATTDQVLRYFALLSRGERFCDGHIAGEFESGKVVAALRRLKELRAAMDEPPA